MSSPLDRPTYVVRSDGSLKFRSTPKKVDALLSKLNDKKGRGANSTTALPSSLPLETPANRSAQLESPGSANDVEEGSNEGGGGVDGNSRALAPLKEALGPGRQRMLAQNQSLNFIADGSLNPRSVTPPRGGPSPKPTENVKLATDFMTSRDSTLYLEASLKQRLDALAKDKDLSRHELVVRSQEVFNDIVLEICRQVATQCTDRARLLAKVWVRSSDMINLFSEMFAEEHERHLAEERATHDQLRAVRKDYLTVVQRMEELIKEQHDAQTELIADQAKREQGLCDEISRLKEELYRATTSLRALTDKPGTPKSGATKRIRNQSGVHEEMYVGLSSSNGADTVTESDTVRELRNELQKQKLALMDAAVEIAKLRDQRSFVHCAGTNTDPPEVTHRASSPVIELLRFLEMDDSDLESAQGSPRVTTGRRSSKKASDLTAEAVAAAAQNK